MTAAPQHSTRRAQRRQLAWVSILGLGLAACTPSVGPNSSLGWMEAGSPKKLEVEHAQYRHSIYFATDRAEISALERDRLLAFLESVQPGGRDDIRISISWKAECFQDAEEARVFDEHLDDIAFDQVVDIWRADCDARGIPLPDAADPLHDDAFQAAIAQAYAGPLSTA